MLNLGRKLFLKARNPRQRRLFNQIAAFAAIMLFASTQVSAPLEVNSPGDTNTPVEMGKSLELSAPASEPESEANPEMVKAELVSTPGTTPRKGFSLNLFSLRR
jgi:hypothetical protein